jgi:hypothetical protein
MVAPTITWRQVTGSAGAPAYASIASLNFGTVTAGTYSYCKVVRPKVTVNSIQSCKWWLSDIGAQRSGASESIGTAAGWVHKYDFSTGAPKVCSATKGSAGFGHESPESSGSAASFNAVSPNSYGDFIALCLKVASAAGDGATTAWGYQLLRKAWAMRGAIRVMNFAKLGETLKTAIPNQALKREGRESRRRTTIQRMAEGVLQTTNSALAEAVKTVVGRQILLYVSNGKIGLSHCYGIVV